MYLKGIEAENFENYKEPALFLAFPSCSFKCDKEAGCCVCQNSTLANYPVLNYHMDSIAELYVHNSLTKAIVFGGLEPFDSVVPMLGLISILRYYTSDPIIIYTGYTKEEIQSMTYIDDYTTKNVFDVLKEYENIIIKYGRFIPNQESHIDPILGVKLASPNQFAEYVPSEPKERLHHYD